MEDGNITKAANLKIFLHLSYKNTQLLSFVKVLFNIFMRQILTTMIFGGYTKIWIAHFLYVWFSWEPKELLKWNKKYCPSFTSILLWT